MSDDVPAAVREAFASHDAFEARDAGFAYGKTPFEATVAVADSGTDALRITVTVRVPTLDAVVTGETVADVVEDGWYETFDRRIEDAFDVTRTEPTTPPSTDRTDDGVVVDLEFETNRGPNALARAVEDAAALVEYVEGTYVQGVIPGYEYGDPVAGLLDRARGTAEGRSEGANDDSSP
jgi:hypothetical protein